MYNWSATYCFVFRKTTQDSKLVNFIEIILLNLQFFLDLFIKLWSEWTKWEREAREGELWIECIRDKNERYMEPSEPKLNPLFLFWQKNIRWHFFMFLYVITYFLFQNQILLQNYKQKFDNEMTKFLIIFNNMRNSN